MSFDLAELEFDNIGDWPKPIRVMIVSAACAVILLLSYFLGIQSEIDELHRQQAQELQLRQQFEMKQGQAVNLPIYIKQMKEMEKSFGAMLQKLPSKTEVPVLLEDVSDAGIRTGLEFKLFKPLPERDKDFYAELPIEISVLGDYHQLAEFASKVANLKRIVVLDRFTLRPFEAIASNRHRARKPLPTLKKNQLLLQITAKTYRYIDEEEA